MKTQHQRYALERVLRNLLIAGAILCGLSAMVECARAHAGEGVSIPDAPPPIVRLDYALPHLRLPPPETAGNERTPSPAEPGEGARGLKDLTLASPSDQVRESETPEATEGEKDVLGITPWPLTSAPDLQLNDTIVVEEKSLAELLELESRRKRETDAAPLEVAPAPGSVLAPEAAPSVPGETAPPPETYHPSKPNGTPKDPFADMPKYTGPWMPQDSLEFHNEVLVKVQARPTYPNLEMQREILESELLEKYNNLLASAGRVAKVEMVMANPVRYAKDGSWLKGEFEQIVHDIWGRRLPVYETDYYVVVLED